MVQEHEQIKIRLAKPHLGNKQRVLKMIGEILENGYLTQGKYVQEFEHQIADYLGVDYAIAVSSGTAALHLSLLALDVGVGDEVIVPAYTFPATVNVIELTGATPVFVDVDLGSYNMKVEDVERAISPKTRVIIPVHIFGNPVDMDAVMEIARVHNLAIIEDAAGAFGSEYKGIKCGTIGTLGCFSFHPRKVITTGEGGMVVTNDEVLAQRIYALRNHGMQMRGARYDCIMPGFNYRMNELQAALGIAQLQDIERRIAERCNLAELYLNALSDISEIAFQSVLPHCVTVWQAFIIRLHNILAEDVIARLKAAEIEASIGTYAIHMLKFYAEKYKFVPSDYPNAAELHAKGVALPFFNGMTSRDVEQVCQVLRGILNEDTTG